MGVSLIQLGAKSDRVSQILTSGRPLGRWQMLGPERFKKLGQLQNFQQGRAAGPSQPSLRPVPFSPFLLGRTRRPTNLNAANTPTLFFRLDATSEGETGGGLGQLRLNDKLGALLPCPAATRKILPSPWSHWLPILADVNAKLLRVQFQLTDTPCT